MNHVEKYAMSKRPFTSAPDPELFFTSSVHEGGLAFLQSAIERGERFVMLTGALGTGKTVLATTLANQVRLAGDPLRVYLPTPLGDYPEVLRRIGNAIGIDVGTAMPSTEALEGRLLRYFEGDTAQALVLILDEAQSYTAHTLERLRLLADATSSNSALLQLVLIGTINLIDRLAEDERQALSDRLSARYELSPLTYPDTREYIYCRLVKSGASGRPVFLEDAITSVQILTQGIPRRINAVCDACLEIAATRGTDSITMEIVQGAGEQQGYSRHGREHADQPEMPEWSPGDTAIPAPPQGVRLRAGPTDVPPAAMHPGWHATPASLSSDEPVPERPAIRFDWGTLAWRATVITLITALVVVVVIRDLDLGMLLR